MGEIMSNEEVNTRVEVSVLTLSVDGLVVSRARFLYKKHVY